MAILSFLLILGTSQVYADSIVVDNNPGAATDTGSSWTGGDENPQDLISSTPTDEEAWLEALLGFNVYFVGKDEDHPFNDLGVAFDYAVLVYDFDPVLVPGPPLPPPDPDHYAIANDDGDQSVFLKLSGLPIEHSTLNHITYFSSTPVPEPSLIVLLGISMASIVGLRRWWKE